MLAGAVSASVAAGAARADVGPWAQPEGTWHAQVTIELEAHGAIQRESAVWQLEPVAGGFCIRVADVRRLHAGGAIPSEFTPLQLEGSGWCLDPALRPIETDQWAGAVITAQAAAAGIPAEQAEATGKAAVAALELQSHLAGLLLFEAWDRRRLQLPFSDGAPMHIDCKPQSADVRDERVVACELDAATLRGGMARAAARVLGMDPGELEDAMRQDMPDETFVVVLQGRFSADTGLPESIAWIPDAQAMMPKARFAFSWLRGPALAPELPLTPQRPWIDHPEPPLDAAGSRNPYYRSTRTPPYPADAYMEGEYGEVVLQVLVGADGRVHTVQVKESSGSASLDAAAQEDVAYWLFYPAMENGVPVDRTVSIPVDFSIPVPPKGQG